ncbi:MAG: AraC family transcriptional regulator [Lachnospiraceae bacterium]|nr:AraC family transcriptional regulator [Lachnospiraceae bacterium]
MNISECSVSGIVEKDIFGSEENKLLKETFAETPGFPVSIYKDDLSREEVMSHWHDEFEIGWISQGTILVNIEGTHTRLKEGQGFFINSTAIHSMRNARTDQPAELRSIIFHSSLIAGELTSIFNQKYVTPVIRDTRMRSIFFGEEDSAILSHIMLAWDAIHEEQEDYPVIVRNELSLLLASLAKRATPDDILQEEKNQPRYQRAQIILDWIHRNYDKNLTLEELAAEASISVSEALRCFREFTDTTPIKYLKRYRLSCAARLLRESDESIASISASCGFQDLSYFSKSFREYYQQSPTKYRNRQNL